MKARLQPRSTSGGFTLVELLIVIAIVALLVVILTPTLTKARDMARKAVCMTVMHQHAIAVSAYVSTYQSYPHFAPWPWMQDRNGKTMMWEDGSFTHELDGWPKFYGLLEVAGLKGTKKTAWGNWYYGGSIEEIWRACFCPAMDPLAILAAANNAGNFDWNGNWLYWVWYHKWAIGYQWSPFLRATTPAGRDPIRLKPAVDWDVDLYQWVMPWVRIDGNWYCTQAVHPMELADPSSIAEAWDSWDLESTPNIPWLGQWTSYGAYTPGWHGGVPRETIGGVANRALFNGARHVASDALLPVNPIAEGMPGEFLGMKAFTWDRYDPTFGNLPRLVPRCEFEP